MTARRCSLPLLVTATISLNPGCRKVEREQVTSQTVVIGAILAQSGPLAKCGESARAGINMAIADIVASGGLLGREPELAPRDDEGLAPLAEAMATEMLAESKPCVVIGGLAKSATRPAAQACQKANVAFVSAFSSDSTVAANGNCAFTLSVSDAQQGAAMARYARQDLDARTAAVVTDSESASSQASSRAFAAVFEESGGKVVATSQYGLGQTDFGAVVEGLARSAPDVIYASGFQPEVGILQQEAIQAGVRAPFLGTDAWLWPQSSGEDAGPSPLRPPALNGYVTAAFAPDAPWPKTRAFAEAFADQFERPPDAFAALGYDAVMLAADAIRRAGEDDTLAVRTALAETTDFEGVTGTFSISRSGAATRPALILRLSGGRAEFVRQIPP
ncbi:MAG: ABC transporter substrate-binding protein [Armatimonadota bacterium]